MRDGKGATEGPTVPLVDVLDRVLAKGIVVLDDADASVLGLHVIEPHGHTIVTSLETFARDAEPPQAETASSAALMAAVDEYIGRLPRGDLPDGP